MKGDKIILILLELFRDTDSWNYDLYVRNVFLIKVMDDCSHQKTLGKSGLKSINMTLVKK